MPEKENAKGFLSQIVDRFVGFEKVKTSTILSKLISMRFQRQREHKRVHYGNV